MPTDIHVKSRPGVLVTLQQPQSRKMNNPLHVFHGGIENIGLQHITTDFEYAATRILKGFLQIFNTPPAEIVIYDHFLDIFLQKLFHHL